ncbi:MAG TPA: NAD-dependent epimerase/dehydratase family protein, partial [Chitinophagaceae bacterium]|nr:NAD-dependent epimerase/dehydratase family protein [Chitinophagaceae bacterium]
RFFTVYGPWGRPDMACQIFATAILQGKPIAVFNHGKMKRDFTYIDDIVLGIKNVIDKPAQPNINWNGKHPDAASSSAPYRIYNIGNNKPVELLHFITLLETYLGKKAIIEMKSLQPGDVKDTWADVDALSRDFNYKPKTTIENGLQQFTAWYKAYYGITEPSEVVWKPVSKATKQTFSKPHIANAK